MMAILGELDDSRRLGRCSGAGTIAIMAEPAANVAFEYIFRRQVADSDQGKIGTSRSDSSQRWQVVCLAALIASADLDVDAIGKNAWPAESKADGHSVWQPFSGRSKLHP
jgi:hypothetical protein